jgi:hypothetical protein
MNCYSKNRSTSAPVQMTKVQFLRKLLPAIVFVATASASNFAAAHDISPLGVEWQCIQQYDESFNVLCIPEPAIPGDVAPEAPGGRIETSLLRAGDLRPAARRGLTKEFFETDQSVPLHVPPRDKAKVNYLLQMVLCDSAPRCSVNYRSY